MASVYSTSFWQAEGQDGETPLLVPEGQLWVLRYFSSYYNPESFLPNYVFVRGDEGQTMIFQEYLLSSGVRWQDWEGRLVISTGCAIITSYPTDVSLSGYVLSLP